MRGLCRLARFASQAARSGVTASLPAGSTTEAVFQQVITQPGPSVGAARLLPTPIFGHHAQDRASQPPPVMRLSKWECGDPCQWSCGASTCTGPAASDTQPMRLRKPLIMAMITTTSPAIGRMGTVLGHKSYVLCRVAGWPSSSPWSTMAEPADQRSELCDNSGQL
jgi:hypothetical protein